jgi:mannan endo-1,4-beta-mannosidase
MRSRTTAAATAVAAAALALLGTQQAVLAASAHTAARVGHSAVSERLPVAADRIQGRSSGLPTRPSSYLGVFEPGTPASYAPIQAFARMAGREPNVVMYYTTVGSVFPSAFAQEAHSHGATLQISIAPYGISMSAIAAGRDDAYLRSYAAAVRAFGHPVIISFAPEMNGKWYPWGWTHTSPRTWVQAWRHVVTLFRRAKASNVTWTWTVNQMTANEGPIADWWPGSAYVTWMAVDGYYYNRNTTFNGIFAKTIAAERKLSEKPIFIGETAIGQVAGQARRIPQLFAGVAHFRLLGFLWFDMAQSGTVFHQDWRLEGHRSAAAAFRRGIRRYMK